MKKSDELKQELAAKIDEQRALNDGAKNDKGEARSFTEEENTKFDGLQAEIEGLKADIKRAEQFEENQRIAAAASGMRVGGSEEDEKKKIKKRYSLHKAMRQSLRSSNGPLDGVEAEMHQEALKQARSAGVEAQGLMVPTFDMRADEQTVTQEGGAYGGNLVATEHQPLIEYLRPTPVLESLGARVMRGLQGNLAFPTNDGGISATWEGEISKVNRSRNAYGKKGMSPKRLAAKTVVSLQNLIQSSIDLERQTMDDINAEIANAVDSAAINGSGVGNVPLGLLNDPDVIALVAGDPDGGPLQWGGIVDHETQIMIENSTKARLAYLINYATKGFLKKTKHQAGDLSYLMIGNNEVNGYPVGVSNLVPGNLTKGAGVNLNASIFGDFNQLLIGNWGFVSMILDEVTLADEGLLKITTNSFWDVLVRQPKAFSVHKDIDIS